HQPRPRGGASDRVRYLPHQRSDRAGRGTDSIRGHEGERVWTLRRPSRDQRVHRTPLDHDRNGATSLSVLMQFFDALDGSAKTNFTISPPVAWRARWTIRSSASSRR